MTEIVGIRFRGTGKTYFFDPCGAKYEEGASVVVETASGSELGEVVEPNRFVEEDKIVPPFRKVLRRASADDLAAAEQRRAEEHAAKLYCQERADARGLDMRVISAERSLDGAKMVFSFVSENRVDFRELVRDLVAQYRTRIELRQVGVRDKAKLLGGLGVCGRPFCCSQFLKDFHPVSIKMAKDQSLSLSPTKISGSCGRLMCCLKYEQEAYSELLKTTPKLGSLVRTDDGDGTITAINLLRRQVKVLLENDTEFSAKYYHIDDIEVLRSGKAKLRPASQQKQDAPEEAPAPARPRPQRQLKSSIDEFESAQAGEAPRERRRPSAEAVEFGVAAEQSEPPRRERRPRREDAPSEPKQAKPQGEQSSDSGEKGEHRRRPRRRGGRGRGGKPKNPPAAE